MKFGSKLMYLNYLHELAQHLQLDQLIIPPAVRKLVDTPSLSCIRPVFEMFPLCTHQELAQHLQLDQLIIPPAVRKLVDAPSLSCVRPVFEMFPFVY